MDGFISRPSDIFIDKTKTHQAQRLSPVCHVVTLHMRMDLELVPCCVCDVSDTKGMQNIGISRVSFTYENKSLSFLGFTYIVLSMRYLEWQLSFKGFYLSLSPSSSPHGNHFN